MTLRVLVCGGRDFDDLDTVWGELDAHHALGPIAVVIQGGAKGADLLGEKWAIANNVLTITFKPDWEAFGPAAGPMRNKRMLDEGKPDLVLAFPSKGPGTANMVKQAKEAGVRVIRCTSEDAE
jgi:hypothetical protein